MATDTKTRPQRLNPSQEDVDRQIAQREEIENLNKQFNLPSAPETVIPSENADPGYQQTGEGESAPQEGQGDKELGDTDPGDSEEGGNESDNNSPGKGGNSSGKGGRGKIREKAQKRIDEWKKKAKEKAGKKAEELGKKAVKKAGKKAALEATKKAADAAGSETVVIPIAIEVADVLRQDLQTAAKAAATGNYERAYEEEKKRWGNRIKWIIIGVVASIVALFLVVVVIMSIITAVAGLKEKERLDAEAVIGSLSITKTGPTTASPGQTITYTVTVNSQTTDDIVIRDTLPVGMEYVSSAQKVTCGVTTGVCDASNRVITWSSKDNSITPPVNTSFTLTARVKPTTNNVYVMNMVTATGVEAAGGAGAAKPVTCSGTICALKYIVDYGRISDHFGTRGGAHKGVDLAGATGTPIYALEGGSVYMLSTGCVVLSVRGNRCGGGGGNYVFVKNPGGKGYQRYMHMQRTAPLKVNDLVVRGQLLGYLGSTGDSSGPHVHFQLENGSHRAINAETALIRWPN